MKKTQKTAISGASGFIGSKLKSYLTAKEHDIITLNRNDFSSGTKELADKINGVSAIVHLAGAPIMKRWTKAYKEQIYNSRILTTRMLVDAMRSMNRPPNCFISASAVGIYPGTGVYDDENYKIAKGFLGEVCHDWESEAMKAATICRSLMFRFGIILGKEGGALKQMLLPFRLGLGGRIGTGNQMMSWVHIDDVLEAFGLALSDKQLGGPVNITAPNPVSNKEFTAVLAKTLRRPAIFPIPAAMLRLVFGEGATVLTQGQQAIPMKLQKHGFQFQYAKLETALSNLLH